MRLGSSAPGNKEDQEPFDSFLWLTGIMVGRLGYLPFLWSFRRHTLVLVDLPWVALLPFQSYAPSSAALCSDLLQLLERHSFHKMCVASHSYGSFVAAWMMFTPKIQARVARVVLLAAPALGFLTGKTCRSVLYDKPFWFESSLAHVFFRHLFVYESFLSAEDLPRGSVVIVSECDEMIPVEEVCFECKRAGIDLLMLPRLRHGWELFWPRSCRTIVRYLHEKLSSPVPNNEPAPAPRTAAGKAPRKEVLRRTSGARGLNGRWRDADLGVQLGWHRDLVATVGPASGVREEVPE